MTEDPTPTPPDNGDTPPAGTDNDPGKQEPAPTPDPAPNPDPTPQDWRANLPEDIRQHPSMAKFTTEEALAKSYINLEKTLGADKVVLPKSDDDQEGWEKVFKALGRPDEPKAYEFKDVSEQLPEGFDYPKETEDAFKDVAHKAGLSVQQAQALRDWFLENAVGQHQTAAQEAESRPQVTMAELQREWGNATGQKLAAAQHAVKEYMGEEFAQALEDTGLGNDPRLVRGFAKIAEITGADKDLTGKGVTTATPAELDDQISGFRAQHKDALFDKLHPEHNRRVQQLHDLYQKRHPEQAA